MRTVEEQQDEERHEQVVRKVEDVKVSATNRVDCRRVHEHHDQRQDVALIIHESTSQTHQTTAIESARNASSERGGVGTGRASERGPGERVGRQRGVVVEVVRDAVSGRGVRDGPRDASMERDVRIERNKVVQERLSHPIGCCCRRRGW